MSKKIKVIMKRPDSKPYTTWISDSLANLQTHVGGYIETVTLEVEKGDQTYNMVVICNEEGRLMRLPYNCVVGGVDFVGTIIIAGVDGEEFADLPMEYADFKKVFRHLWKEA